MNRLKTFLLAMLFVSGAFSTQAQNIEADYLKQFSASFTNDSVTHRATNLFWSLCVGKATELSNEELKNRYAELVTDSNMRIAFYKRFNYYLSGVLGYYPDLLNLTKRVEKSKKNQSGWEDVFTSTDMQSLCKQIHSYGQDAILAGSWDAGPSTAPTLNTQVYMNVESVPEFPGGDAALIKFLQKHIIYPEMERNNDIQGKVILKFRVCEDGYLCTASAVRGASQNLDAEALRVLKMMPNFKPGMFQGKPVSVWFMLPVSFRLQ